MNIDDIYADLQDMSNLSGPSLDENTLTIEPDPADSEPKTDWLLNNPFDFIEPMAMDSDDDFKDHATQQVNDAKTDLDELLALVSPSSAIPDLNFDNPPTTSSPTLTLDAIVTESDSHKGDFGKCIDQLVAETLQAGDMERESLDEPQNPLMTATNSVGLEDFPELLLDNDNLPKTGIYHQGMCGPSEEMRHPYSFPFTSLGGGFRSMAPIRPSYLPHPFQAVPPCRMDYTHATPIQHYPGWQVTGMPGIYHENQPSNQLPTEIEDARARRKPAKLWPDRRVTRKYKIESVDKVPKSPGKALVGILIKHSWGLSVKVVERPLKETEEPKPLENKQNNEHQLRRKSLNILRKRKLSK